MARWVSLGFSTDEEANKFLNYVLGLDDHGRKLIVADRLPGNKVKLTEYRIKAANIREDET